MDVLRGADALIKRPQVRWIIETHTPKLERDCLAILQAAGYQTRVVPNAWWRVILPEMRIGHNRWFVATRKNNMSL